MNHWKIDDFRITLYVPSISMLFYHKVWVRSLAVKSISIYQQLCSFLPLYWILCHYASFSYSKTLPDDKNQLFLVKISSIHIRVFPHVQRIFSLKIIITLLWHEFGRRQIPNYDDIEVCKEAKTIIFVDIWLST